MTPTTFPIRIWLTGKDAATKCHKILTHLLTQFLDVDESVAILPVEPPSNLDPIQEPLQLPLNLTKLGWYICIRGDAYSFWSPNNWLRHCKHPEPWLAFNLTSLNETSYILQSISMVNQGNGHTKHIQLFHSLTVLLY